MKFLLAQTDKVPEQDVFFVAMLFFCNCGFLCCRKPSAFLNNRLLLELSEKVARLESSCVHSYSG